ncbi:sigma-B regulation protein RsbU (phosphoserine phosphatase) [Halanaerobium saccharolyticum]|uniref:Sigma-B regulation protein RsbU (Phosphoserine phosphatase) n=1 Tax=Halanaerobium saccharolyticum TaxID=43595 RepID=A0A4R7Z4X5_9FIRM|nr:PP2C family protein-serine/threonine phosphatase [Halanaerobium saccharolyticum]RAK08130.1 sigma-B regulation protein RsbU (phosphoserine phosphatase) [Halanaerobium saccharolyticum]TDW04337.1 sigma-B regulation protein RsbU (phosphoserine phosphatase) [Halanaerobium saccharolyticum]TDX59628.1 sigma-B regulation protein RsbU (phosphoserine phosphatase) [Halanaerobium saccharolyticum]
MNLSLMLLLLFLMTALIIVLAVKIMIDKKDFRKLESQAEIKNLKLKEQHGKIKELEDDLKSKLKKARNIHQRMLPDKLAEPADYFISDYYQPAEYIGGDYYNVFKIDHGALDSFFDQYLLYFFDVSGHGIDSTLLSIFVNDSIENYFKLRHSPGEKISTSKLMNYIDQRYQNEGFPDDYLVCLFIAVLDKKKSTLNYSSGGFQYPIYKLDQEEQIKEINIGGLPISAALGALPDSREEQTLNFEKNNTLMLSTDGLLEQSNGQQQYFQQLQGILKKYKFLPAPFLKDLIRSDFYKFTNDSPGKDDITFLLVERPAGEIINCIFDQENNNAEAAEIKEFLDQNLWSEHPLLQTFKDIITDLLKNPEFKLKIKALNKQQLLMFSLENLNDKTGWDSILNYYPDLISIAEKDLNRSQNGEADISFNKKEIYFSHTASNNRMYLMLIKEDDLN